jgi:hypothetical protein
MSPYEQIQEKITRLQDAMLASHPMMPSLLREIHTALKADPEVVTLLQEPEILVIVNGLKAQTKVEIATSVMKSKSTTKALKNITLAEL